MARISLLKGLARKYRVNQILVDEGCFYRAKVFDFSLNKVVLLTVIGDFERGLFDILKARFFSERKEESFGFILDVYDVEYLEEDNAFYYTQEFGETLLTFDPKPIIGEDSIQNWFYMLALPSFYSFLDISRKKNSFHGFISPNTVYYSNKKIKIGDYILGILADINPQIIIESPLFYDAFFSTDFSKSDLDTYALLKILKLIDSDNYSKVLKTINFSCGRTDLSNSVNKFITTVYENKNLLSDKFIFEMKPLLEKFELFKREITLYRPERMPLLYSTISSWDLSKLRNIVVVHINHYLNDIIELNKVFSSLFEKLVYVVVPYSTETKILPSRSYSTYYHEIENNIYFVKKDVDIITDTNDFYSAMYESIKAAFKHDVIPLVCQGKKVIIIEDGGFHYNIINELIHTYPVLETAIIGVIEQTTSGVRRYKDFVNSINIPYPVLSVARSKIKMRLESHFIARRVIDELNYLLYMANNFLSFHKVLIIGYGIIGRNISSALSALKCNIEVYDIEDGILSIAKDDGINVIDSIQNIQFTDNLIIIGATGEAAFTSLMFFSFVTSDAKKIYLASASSKRIEFQNIVNFFEVGDKDEAYRQIIDEMKNILIEQKDYGTIYNFRYKDVDKKIVLIANGYPVNFFRKNIISLTESVIDLINCEIFILIEYLLKEKENLKPQLYLLGSSDLHSLDVEEECLVQSWVNLLALQFDETDGTIWKRFDVHPFEDSLRNNCLPTTEKGAKK